MTIMKPTITLKQYKKEKRKLLKDFLIYLNSEEKEHLESLENEIQVDQYCRKLLKEKL